MRLFTFAWRKLETGVNHGIPHSINRALAAAVVVWSVLIIWAAGMTFAKAENNMPNQSNSSNQSGSAGNSSQPKPERPSGVAGHGILNEGMKSGQVDQEIRVEGTKVPSLFFRHLCARIKRSGDGGSKRYSGRGDRTELAPRECSSVGSACAIVQREMLWPPTVANLR